MKGAGSASTPGGGDTTNISDGYDSASPLLTITTVAGTFRMYGLTIKGGTLGGTPSQYAKYDGIVAIYGASTDIRVDHVHFNTDTYVNNSFGSGLEFLGCNAGVVDHSIFTTTGVINSIRVFNQATCNGDPLSAGDQSWTIATNLGSASASRTFYIEDNTFTGVINDCMQGGRFVIRYNTMLGSKPGPVFQTHSTGSGDRNRGCRSWEIYLNQIEATATYDDVFNSAFYVESGTGVIWRNHAPSTETLPDSGSGFKIFILMISTRGDAQYMQGATPLGWGYCGTNHDGTGSNWDGNSPSAATGYPCIDQIGRGAGDLLSGYWPNAVNTALGNVIAWPRQPLEPVYEWLDDWTAVPHNSSFFLAANSDYYAENVDYYLNNAGCVGGGACTTGVGSGTTLPATCTVGTGFDKTNGGSWNGGTNSYYATGQDVLYKCTSTNTWTLSYSPYTYPHPLANDPTTTTTGLGLHIRLRLKGFVN